VTSTLGIELVSTQLSPRGENVSRTLRPLAVLAMVGLVAVISAGCSSTPAETGTGSSGGNNTAATHEKAVKFAECMRRQRTDTDGDPRGLCQQAGNLGGCLDPSEMS
jgi:hypothetical protein